MYLEINNRDISLFEIGIKFGCLYHQFIGIPLNLNNIDSIINCIEKSILLQPYVTFVKVILNKDYVSKEINKHFGYTELKGEMIEALIELEYEEYNVKASLKYDLDSCYPLMKVESISIK